MPHITTQRHRKLFARRPPRAPAARHRTRHPQVGAAIGHACHLRHDAARLGKGLIHVPQRAGAANLAEVKVGGRLPFADVASPVDPDEKERHPACTGPLQGRQAVAHRLKPHTKLGTEPINVITHGLGGLHKRGVGQHQRPGKVVGQPDAGQGPGLVARQASAVGQTRQGVALLQKRQLRRHLKSALPALQPRRQLQHTGLGLKHPLSLPRQVGHIHHPHPMRLAQAPHQRFIGAAGQQSPFGSTALCRVV